ncbi:chloride channel protein [Candidatus Thiosymbion oneisti]|uniref:chloride channel protein n=2 Tax=Candidatus Thiosymbion oneisti TaxID=589554 RepID=UPI001AAD06FB|nr:chloride channel protein [Candidatus Thiosymbion oneisti]
MTSARAMWLRLTLLGVVSGVMASLVVLAFRAAIALGQFLLLPQGARGGYPDLDPWLRLLLPVAGGLLLGLIFDRLRAKHREVGVVHVLHHLHTPGKACLPATNLFTQLGGAVTAIVTGHAVDTEGPAVHIGAASASQLGRRLRVSAEEDHILAASGAAAAIAAAFNTPLAGVVFVVEVLRVRYEVSRFLPIIVASVVGAVISRLLLQADPILSVPPLDLNNHWELPNLILLGLTIGVLAIGFISWCEAIAVRTRTWSNRLSFTLAGLVTGILALWTPEIMGSSYATLDRLLAGKEGLGLGLVLALTLTKLAATGTAVGLRVPGGLIGPTLFIGGAAGSAFGMLFDMLGPMDTASPAFYATVGMAAMMGASLRAPLAALIALLELTGNPNVILPGMLAVATADITNQLAIGRESVFEILLRSRGSGSG